MQLVRPAAAHLSAYIAALQRGWSADNLRATAAQEELERIEADAEAFLATMEDREAKGPPVTLPDGSVVQRIPGFRRWMWDDRADPDNVASQRVIEANGGVLFERFTKPPQFGNKPGLRYRIALG